MALGSGCKISYGGGQTATVTMSYMDLLDVMRPWIELAAIDVTPSTTKAAEEPPPWVDAPFDDMAERVVPKDGSDSV